MDGIYALGLLLLVLLFGPWVIVAIRGRRNRRERQQDRQHLQELRDRVAGLELAVANLLRAQPNATIAGASEAPTKSHPGRDDAISAPPATNIPEPSSETVAATPADLQPTPPEPRRPVSQPTPVFAYLSRLPRGAVAGDNSHKRDAVQSGPTWLERIKGELQLEELLGGNLLGKLGIVLVVFGIAFFLAYQLRQVGPAGKVLVGYLVGAALLGGGIFLERRARYRIFARGGIGGGWALVFFTTYAMYHVPAAHVLSSQIVDLLLLLAVAAAMVLHSLRYRSQVVTGMAFLLAFSTVTISHVTVYSLSAGAVLVLALVVVVARMKWFELEIFGLLAAYLNHWWWLRPIIEPMHGHKHPFPEFIPSAALLIFYWLAFRISYVWRTCEDQAQERLSTIAALLNSVLLLFVLKYQSVRPEWGFWALLVIGVAEMGLAQVSKARRHTAFVVLSTIGATLLIAAIPFRYSGGHLAVLWILESEALFLAGVFTREGVFRRLGMIASLLVPAQWLAYDAAQILGRRMDGADLSSQPEVAIVFAVAGLALYFNAHVVGRRRPELFSPVVDRTLLDRSSYVGGLMLLVAAWAAFPNQETIVVWAALALALSFVADRLQIRALGWQANLLFAAAVIRALMVNLHATATWGHLSQRLVTIGFLAASIYVAFRWMTPPGAEKLRFARRLPAVYQWVGSALVMLLMWYELRPIAATLGWAILGLVLLEVGLARRAPTWRLQAYAALALSFVRMFFVNLNAAGAPGEISPRFYSTLPLACVFFYAYARLTASDAGETSSSKTFNHPELFAWAGTITVAALMRFELGLDWVVTAWAALAFALLALAWWTSRRIFLQQAVVGALAVLFRAVLHNVYERSYLPAPLWQERLPCLAATAAILLAALFFAYRLPKPDERGKSDSRLAALWRALLRHPEQIFFFVPLITLTLLLAAELRASMIAVGWSTLGVGAFLFGLWLHERSFRWSGLCLLLLGVAKMCVVDVWSMGARDRYLTFIAVGAASVLVSFLYSRFREAIRQYL
jgi:hypothetical protein